MGTCNVELKSWSRFLTRTLAVAPELLGQRHTFSFAGAIVCLQLPDVEMVDRPSRYDEVASSGPLGASKGEAEYYEIHKVDVEVSLSVTRAIPEAVLTRPPKAFELFTDSERKDLDNLTDTHRAIAVEALDYWLRVVRWVTDDFRIGQAEVSGSGSEWATYLVDAASEARVWAGTHMGTVESLNVVKQDQWLTMQAELEASSSVPVHVTLRHDALQSLRNGDYGSALLFAAMSCETYLRHTVHQHLPADLSPKRVKHVERARISQYLGDFFPEIVIGDALQQYQALKPKLSKLFERRNTFVHTGDSNGLTRELCLEFVRTTKDLFSIPLSDG